MRKFEILKTLQLVLFGLLTAVALYIIFSDSQLYQMIARNPNVRILSFILWLVLALSFVFLFFDFGSYTHLKRENIELDQAVYTDALTGAGNRYSCDAYIGRYTGRELPKDMGCITLDLTNLSEINRREGHEGGDRAIRAFADILMEASRQGIDEEDFFLGRNGGNKFLIIMKNTSTNKMKSYMGRVSQNIQNWRTNGNDILHYSAGSAFAGTEDVRSLAALVALSDGRAGGNTELGNA